MDSVSNTKMTDELLKAACAGDTETVRRLVERENVNANATDRFGWTAPLIKASNEGHFEISKLLLDNGASVDAADEDGWTSLMQASSEGHCEVVTLLLDNGASVYAADKDGWTPLMSASCNGHCEIAQLLLDKNLDANISEINGRTALDCAMEQHHSEIVVLILDHEIETLEFKLDRGASPQDMRTTAAESLQKVQQPSQEGARRNGAH